MKKIIIFGKDSFLGESLNKWLLKWPNEYFVQIVSTLKGEWKKADFTNVDAVVNFAGIAHVKKMTKDMEPLFYSVNRDLAIEMCDYVKSQGIYHFIQFSSMNVYGDYCNIVTDRELTNPTSFYGKSKLEGDLGIFRLNDDNFKVASIRPPFVYGKGCKGNYNSVRKLSLKLPIFPNYKNKKSMIYIDNLCEFIRLLIESKDSGVFTPQNKELVSTSDLVFQISKVNNHKIFRPRIFNWLIPLARKISGSAKKAFINDSYDLSLSNYFDWKYCVVDFENSIRLTEGKE